MQQYNYPLQQDWAALCTRPTLDYQALDSVVSEILASVREQGDPALFDYTERFDGIRLDDLKVTTQEIEAAEQAVSDELKAAIQLAQQNIECFHTAQLEQSQIIEPMQGVQCWRKSVGIERVGLYIPGGSAPLFSTILMLGIPAKLAACKTVVLCTPPDKTGAINPAILYTAKQVGITEIYKVGGAQAIAAMAYGTASIPQCYKLFGPGNQFVTKAKELVQSTGIAIDMPAGPSEVLVIADQSSNPAFVAADLLSQAEHGADSQVILLADTPEIIEQTLAAVAEQLSALPRRSTAEQALKNSRAILLNSIDDCLTFSNQYAPEHLILASENATQYIDQITQAGSVFLGNYSCESAGDYASGTNHTLPTNGYARNYSGVSVDSFVKKITFQQLTATGIQNIGNAIETMAAAEGLTAHKNAVTIRLKALENV